MDHFTYRDGALTAEDVALADIAAAVGTPFYCYSTATLERHFRVFADAFSDVPAIVCFAVKANGNLAVLRTLAEQGAGADVVSEGELRRALAAGIPGERIVFSGVGKTREEMAFALAAGVLQFNVESEPELVVLDEVARAMGRRAPVTVRVNPDVDAKTHVKISTGRKENKFGIAIERAPAVYALAAQCEGIEVVGVDVHIGSQLTDLAPFGEAFRRVVDLVGMLRAEGHRIGRLDLGGGLGIPYNDETPPTPEDYAAVVKAHTRDLDCTLVLEPGRLIAGNAGVLVTSVIYVKDAEARRFVIVDAAMNDLMRPALYGAHHDIVPLRETADGAVEPVDVVGPVCESTDIFATQRLLPPLAAGDMLAFRSAGAYGAVMASTYNSRLLVPEVLVRGDRFAIVRPRPTYEDLLSLDRMPEWFGDAGSGRGAA